MKNALLLLALLHVPVVLAGEERAVRYDGFLPGAAPERVAAALVLDARTGEPIAGARMAQYLEEIEGGFFGAPLLGETATDGYGLARLGWDREPVDCHWVFEAPGYAVIEEYGKFPPEVVDLPPAGTVRGRILDPLGRPRAGAVVECFVGCGHGPAARHAVTDPEGRFRIDGVDVVGEGGRLWITMDGASFDYEFLSRFACMGEGGATLVADPGVTVRGTIVAEDGTPLAGAELYSDQWHRGPAARADERGRFRLSGLPPEATVELFVPAPGGWRWLALPSGDVRPRRDGDVTIRVPASWDSSDLLDLVRRGAVPARVRATAADGAAVAGLTVRLLRESDGWIFEGTTDTEGLATVEAPPGPYLLSAGAPFESHMAPAREVAVAAGEPPLGLEVRPRPRLVIEGLELDPETASLTVATAGAAANALRDPPIHLDPGEPAALVLREGPSDRAFPIPATEDGVRRVRYEVGPHQVIRLAPLPPDASFAEAELRTPEGVWLSSFSRVEGDALVIETRATGPAWVHIRYPSVQRPPEPVLLPTRAGDPIEIPFPPLAEEKPGTLLLIGPDGTPARDTGLHVGMHDDWADTWIEEGGTYTDECVREGARVIATREGWLPLRGELGGPGPWTLNWPPTEIDLCVRTAAGEPVDFRALVGGSLFDGKTGVLRLRGVPPGPHRIVVGTKEQGGRIVAVEVPREGAATIEVHLD